MNQNDKRNDQNNKGGKNAQGILRLVAWALLLTLVLRYAGLYINSRSGNAASAEIPYSTFITLIEDGKAEFVRNFSELFRIHFELFTFEIDVLLFVYRDQMDVRMRHFKP